MYKVLHIKCPLFSSDFNKPWIFSECYRKILKYKTSRKSVQLKPICCMLTNGQTDRPTDKTDMTKIIVAFRNSGDALNKKWTWAWMNKENTRIVLMFCNRRLHLNFCKAHKFASHPEVAVSSKSLSFQQNHSTLPAIFANAVTQTVLQLLCQSSVLLAPIWSTRLWNVSAHERGFPRIEYIPHFIFCWPRIM